MDDIRIGFMRGIGYIMAFIFVSIILGIILFVCIMIRANIENNQNKKLSYDYIEIIENKTCS